MQPAPPVRFFPRPPAPTPPQLNHPTPPSTSALTGRARQQRQHRFGHAVGVGAGRQGAQRVQQGRAGGVGRDAGREGVHVFFFWTVFRARFWIEKRKK
jgi:hypothetical protein